MFMSNLQCLQYLCMPYLIIDGGQNDPTRERSALLLVNIYISVKRKFPETCLGISSYENYADKCEKLWLWCISLKLYFGIAKVVCAIDWNKKRFHIFQLALFSPMLNLYKAEKKTVLGCNVILCDCRQCPFYKDSCKVLVS